MKKVLNSRGGKVFSCVIFLLFVVVASCFAEETIAELDEWGDKILSLIGSRWVQAICSLAFVAECGGLIFAGRQQDGMIKKFLPWMMGTIGMLGVSGIVSFFFGSR